MRPEDTLCTLTICSLVVSLHNFPPSPLIYLFQRGSNCCEFCLHTLCAGWTHNGTWPLNSSGHTFNIGQVANASRSRLVYCCRARRLCLLSESIKSKLGCLSLSPSIHSTRKSASCIEPHDRHGPPMPVPPHEIGPMYALAGTYLLSIRPSMPQHLAIAHSTPSWKSGRHANSHVVVSWRGQSQKMQNVAHVNATQRVLPALRCT